MLRGARGRIVVVAFSAGRRSIGAVAKSVGPRARPAADAAPSLVEEVDLDGGAGRRGEATRRAGSRDPPPTMATLFFMVVRVLDFRGKTTGETITFVASDRVFAIASRRHASGFPVGGRSQDTQDATAPNEETKLSHTILFSILFLETGEINCFREAAEGLESAWALEA